MKKYVLIPDSFKGTMSSAEICGIMKDAILKFRSDAEIVSIPVADGGEGSVDAFLSAVGGEKRTVTVKGPRFDEMEAFYGVIDNGQTAVIEMAACAGLPLMGDNRDVENSTTYGVGELMRHAAESGCRKIIVGLGGSATNDAGAGAASAAGIRFIGKDGKSFIPTGKTLCDIESIDFSGYSDALRNTEMITMCDIDNPLYGETGAAYVFGPQKGATPEIVKRLDAGLRNVSDKVLSCRGLDISNFPGAGAAGGMGGGMVAFFGAKLQMGIDTVLDTVHFDDLVAGADLVFSGEGKIDTQSIRGKVVIGVARRAKKAGVPLIAVVGDIGDDIDSAYEMGVSSIFSTNRVAVDFPHAKLRAKNDMRLTMENIMRFYGINR